LFANNFGLAKPTEPRQDLAKLVFAVTLFERADKPTGAHPFSIFSKFEAGISGLSKEKIRTTLIYLLPQMTHSAFKKEKDQQQH